MATNTGGGSTSSFYNTPQAVDDSYAGTEDTIYYFDVMANDLGGNAKVLWSIDDTTLDELWDINLGAVALMWRGGCIIRSRFLGKIKEAFERNPPALVDRSCELSGADLAPALALGDHFGIEAEDVTYGVG